MLERIISAFHGRQVDLENKKALLSRAEGEIETLRRETEKLQKAQIDFNRLQSEYESLSKQLEQTTEELSKAVLILQSPQFANVLKQYEDEKK
jgi:hypothetical protein